MIHRLKLLSFAITLVFFHSSLADAGPADELVADARLFCSDTPTGKSYPSFSGCMDYQKEGTLAVMRAIKRGYSKVAMDCLIGAKYEKHTDLAAAGLCVIVKEPSLAR